MKNQQFFSFSNLWALLASTLLYPQSNWSSEKKSAPLQQARKSYEGTIVFRAR